MGLMQKNDPRAIRAQEERVQKMMDASISFSTRVNYRSDLYKYLSLGYNLPSSVPEVVKYLNDQCEHYNPRTLDRHLKALRYWHKIGHFIDPTDSAEVQAMRRGIKNTYGTPLKKAKPFTLEDMHTINSHYENEDNFYAMRNNALLQLGFFGAFRRSELTKIRIEDLTFTDKGVTIFLPRSKTDQAGLGETIGIPFMKGDLCPVKILKHWIDKSGIQSGCIFPAVREHKVVGTTPINPNALYTIIKTVAEDCEFKDPELYSGHSLRRGCATEAARNGANMHSIMKHGRWKDVNTVAGYIDDACKFTDNAASFLDIYKTK